MAWTTPRTWIAGEFVDDADLNEQIRDNLLAAFPLAVNGWTSYTPTLTQSGAVAKTVTYAKYQRVGRIITVQVFLSCTGAGTAANAVVVGLPVTAAHSTLISLGVGAIFDSSAGTVYKGLVIPASTTTIQFRPMNTTTAGVLGADTFTLALASGDTVDFTATYEAAS